MTAELARLDDKVMDGDMSLLLPSSLPRSYANLIRTLTYGRTTISASKIIATLLSFNQCKKSVTDFGSNEGVGRAVRYNQGGRKE